MSHAVQPDNLADDTRKFQEMAIRSLVRRVRRNPERNALDNLIKAIKTKDMKTECIRIPRSLDGRMQVRQKKTVPHVLYCQIWRWNDLKSYHEIHGILTCRYAYGKIFHQCSTIDLVFQKSLRAVVKSVSTHITMNALARLNHYKCENINMRMRGEFKKIVFKNSVTSKGTSINKNFNRQ